MNWEFVSDDTIREMFHRPMSYSQIAVEFPGVTRNMVAGRCKRLGLVREGKALKPIPKPAISAAERAERAQDERDLDILSDIKAGHTIKSTAAHYGVHSSYINRLLEAWREAA